MTGPEPYLIPSEAAAELGVSAKALRLYEQRGLLMPVRSAAGWRAYGADEMARAREIVGLRALGLSLAQVARVLNGEPGDLAPVLAAHEAALDDEIRRLNERRDRVRGLRAGLANGETPAAGALAMMVRPVSEVTVAFDLPWPWGGERFELRNNKPITYITGPLGSGKTRFARMIAEALPDATFIGLDRLENEGAVAQAQIAADEALAARVEEALHWLIEEGATETAALTALITALEADGPEALVIDMVEQGLDAATQTALAARLRHRPPGARPLFLLTRSSAMLDLEALGPCEALILCPANHNPPLEVMPYPGAEGYEALATCLAAPEARARTEGVIAWRPEVA